MLDTRPSSTRAGSYGRVVKVLLAAPWVCLAFTLIYISFGSTTSGTVGGSLMDFSGQNQRQSETPHRPQREKNEFAERWAAVQYGGPFDGEPLRKLCKHKKGWNTTVVFQLNGAMGGLANVRAMAMDFIYLAVHARVPIILPTFIERNPDDISDITRDGVANLHFDHFFDKKHFLDHMNEYCPQMKIYETVEDAPHNHTIKETWDPPPARKYRWAGSALQKRIKQLWQWMDEQDDYSEYDINLVQIRHTFFNYDLEPIPRQRRMFGSLLQTRPDIRRLAGKAVYRLGKLVGGDWHLDPNDQIHRSLFLGMHLRTEFDADKVGWLGGADASYARQASHTIDIAVRRGYNLIYVASGSLDEVHKLAGNASEHGLKVISKEDLLDEQDLAALHALGFDQQAELDFEILSRSDFFVGPGISSFTWNIAIRRYQFNLKDERRKANPLAVQEYTKTAMWDDGLSRIIERQPRFGMGEMEYFGPHFMFP